MKTCNKCHISKEDIDFYKCKLTPDGLHSWCKACKNEHGKQWRKANPTYITTWRLQNPERYRQNKRKWDRLRMNDPLYRLSNNLRGNMYHALKAKKGFRKWEDLVGYTLEELSAHLEKQFTGKITWDTYGNLWQVDHITPKSWFDYQSPDDPKFKACWALSNLQPKLKIDNARKGNRYAG